MSINSTMFLSLSLSIHAMHKQSIAIYDLFYHCWLATDATDVFRSQEMLGWESTNHCLSFSTEILAEITTLNFVQTQSFAVKKTEDFLCAKLRCKLRVSLSGNSSESFDSLGYWRPKKETLNKVPRPQRIE